MTVANHDPGENEFWEDPTTRRSRPGVFLRWLVVALAIAAAIASLWLIRFSGLDDEEAVFGYFVIFILGPAALGFFVLLLAVVKASPSDPPPRSSSMNERLAIAGLRAVIVITAIFLVLAMYASF